MTKLQFTATLYRSGGFVCLALPEKASARIERRRVPVVGTLNGFPIRTSVFPTEDGRHFMLVNRAMQKGAGVGVGERVRVILQVDLAPRRLKVPPDVRQALAESKLAQAAFDKLSFSRRKEHLDYIAEAKRPDTRARRIEQTIQRLADPTPSERKAFDAIFQVLSGDPRVTESNWFWMPCIKFGGKPFVALYQQMLVVKIGAERAQAVIKRKRGSAFDPSGKERPLRDWVVANQPERKWLALAQAGRVFVEQNK
jgi:hypothetical protein